MIIKINGDAINSHIIPKGSIDLNMGLAIFDDTKKFTDFISEVKAEGLFHAIYGKSFFQVCKDFFSELFHDIGVFILGNGDLFFLLPAIVFMGTTWMIGKNKFTKWIIPLWFGYFLTRIFYHMIK